MKKLNLLLLSAAIILFSSCGGGGNVTQSDEKNVVEEAKSETIVGNDKDSHGCVTSAGYVWCQVLNKCIRLWEDGVKMEYLDKSFFKDGAEFCAYLVFSSDSLKAEFFDVKADKPIILASNTQKSTWSKSDTTAVNVNGKWVVKKGADIINIEVK